MTRPARLRRLHFLNALFAPLTGNDLYLAQQIDDAITATLPDPAERLPTDPDFVQAAAALFARLCGDGAERGFFHWDVSDPTEATPLFARARLMQGLKQVAACDEATVLVTSLRSSHAAASGRWSPRRRRDYDETLDLLRHLTASRTRRGANVNVLFL